MDETRTSFGDLLRRLRSTAGLSQEDLAERSGVSRNGISDLERGLSHTPRFETVRLLADGLGIDEDERAGLLAAARPTWTEASLVRRPRAQIAVPRPLTRLIGRETETQALHDRLQDDAVRWLTLTGPGGVGKTRLAIAAAASIADTFPDGVVFVDLTPVGDPALVLSTIASALAVRESAGHPLIETLAAFLAPRRLLLVLDNCERVLAGAPDLTTLLAASPGLTIVATSRAPFRVRGEHEFPVLPLPLPAVDGLAPIEDLANVPAVALFVERARACRPDVALTTDNAPVIAGICRRLDGLPLAIELAAARVKVLPPAALLARLEQRLPLLTGGGPDLPARQRTMREAIAWSYDLLNQHEQALFRRLAIFVGGFTLEGVEAVYAAAGGAAHDMLEGVVALVDKSLVHQGVDSAGSNDPDSARFNMLETVREFGAERLAESGEGAAMRTAHAAYFLNFAERAQPAWETSRSDAWRGRFLSELANVRAALHWLEQTGDVDAALRLAGELRLYWFVCDLITEGSTWLEKLVVSEQHASADARATGLLGAGFLALGRGDYPLATCRLEESLGSFRDLGDHASSIDAIAFLGFVAEYQGDEERAVRLYEEQLALARAEQEPFWVAYALESLGDAAYRRGDLAQARRQVEEALAIFADRGYRFGVIMDLGLLGAVALGEGNIEEAAWALREALAGALTPPATTWLVAEAFAGLAAVAVATSQAARAATLLGAVDALLETSDRVMVPNHALHHRAIAATRAALGETTFAQAWDAGRVLPLQRAVAEAFAVGTERITADHPSVPLDR
jgi:predicted ATPase/DNA-binding XRE family transcriptional regulator